MKLRKFNWSEIDPNYIDLGKSHKGIHKLPEIKIKKFEISHEPRRIAKTSDQPDMNLQILSITPRGFSKLQETHRYFHKTRLQINNYKAFYYSLKDDLDPDKKSKKISKKKF